MSDRETDGKLMEVLRRVELALSEVKLVERREKGVVLDRAVINKDGLVRARKAFTRATEFVASIRLEEGTASGRVRSDRKAVSDACTRLTHLEKKLVELEQL